MKVLTAITIISLLWLANKSESLRSQQSGSISVCHRVFHGVHKPNASTGKLVHCNREKKSKFTPVTRYPTRLFTVAPHVSTVAASGVLTLSSLAGCWLERRIPISGILGTMAIGATLSSSFPSVVPSQHPLYDLCWTLFLPGSLALLLLSSRPPDTNDASSQDVIWDLSLPFLMASIGSIMGCVLSFFVCCGFPNLWLRPEEALLAACCLCASFIGGTVNFFATARVLGGVGSMSTLMSSMAAADTFVMALYFATMAVALKSKLLENWFQSTKEPDNPLFEQDESDYEYTSTEATGEEVEACGTPRERLTGATLVTTLALAIVGIANKLEKSLAPIVPGTACAVIATLTPFLQRTLLSARENPVTREMLTTATSLSEFTLLLFFASIGQGANIGHALKNGVACVCFSLLALSVHIVMAFALSIFAKRLVQPRIQLEDVLVASNAAIGGPATAAAFAGRMKGNRQRGLTMAGTVWGVIGYAVGTTIGVSLHGVLRRFI